MKTSNLITAALGIALVAINASGDTYDAAAAFSASNNPNGVWSYGYYLGGNSPANFVLFNATTNPAAGVDEWYSSSIAANPDVNHNGTASPISYLTLTLAPGQMSFHPGSAGQAAVVRFTAPTADFYSLDVQFSGLDHVGTTTDVHVAGGAFAFNGAINGYGSLQGYSNPSGFLNQGDFVDFWVGFGNGSFVNDTTGIQAVLSNSSTAGVPDGGLTGLMAATSMLILVAARRRILA